MEALTIIAIGVAWLLILVGIERATRKRSSRGVSKEEALFFYKQGFYDKKQDFDHAWKWYQELFMKGGKDGY